MQLSKEGKKKYAERAPAAETPFAHFKKNLGFRQFLCRGVRCVTTEFTLLCTGYNLRKIARIIMDPCKRIAFNAGLG